MKNKYIFIAIILIIVIGTSFYIWRDLNKLSIPSIQIDTLNLKNNDGDIDSQTNDNNIDNNLGQINIKMPDLDREFYFKDSLPVDVKESYLLRIKDIIAEIKKNSDFVDNWLVLGVYLKTIGDYETAEEVWQYAGVIRPLNSTSFANLGSLYTYELKDYEKAEANFRKALVNDSSKIYIYRNFYELYKFGMKDDTKAKAILKEGIAANPDTSDDLQSLLSNNF